VNYYSNKHYWEDQFLLGHVQGLCWRSQLQKHLNYGVKEPAAA